jgi:hypothetical protein
MEKKSINYSRISFVFMMSLTCSVLFFPSIILASRLVSPRGVPVIVTPLSGGSNTKSVAAPISVAEVNLEPTKALIETAKTNKKSYDSAKVGSPEKAAAKAIYEASVAAAVLSLQALATAAKIETAGNNKTKILSLIADNAPCNLAQAIGDGGASLFSADLKTSITRLLADLSGFGKNVNTYLNLWKVSGSNTASSFLAAASTQQKTNSNPNMNKSFSSR